MARRIPCPWPEFSEAWIDLPDAWFGAHAQRHDEAVRKAEEFGPTLMTFAASLAVLEDWHLPGLNGNPEKWDFTQIDLRLIAWVNSVTIGDYNLCYAIPKALSSPSPAG